MGKKSKGEKRSDKDKARTKLRKLKRVIRSNGIVKGRQYLESHPQIKTFYSDQVKTLKQRYPLDIE